MDRPSALASVAAALALVFARVGVAQSGAEDGGPVIVGEPRERWKAFDVARLDAYLDFYTRYRRDEINPSAGSDRTDTEWLIRETLGISTRAFVGHRNFLELNGDARLGWQDEFIDNESEGVDGHESGLVDYFDVNALFLGEGPAPLTVYARRDETLLDRTFAPSIESRTFEYGASLRLFRDRVPTTIRYFHRDQEYSDQVGTIDDEQVQDTAALHSVWASDPQHRLTVDYTWDSIDESRRGGFDNTYQRHNAVIIHEFRFGSKNQHDLRSIARVLSESGDRDRLLLRLNEVLTLRHSDRLESRYSLTAEQREVGPDDQTFLRGTAQVTHRLFDSLVTTATAGGSHASLPDDDFTSSEAFGRVLFEYTKLVPYGQLKASLGFGVTHREDSERGSTIMIVDRPGVFSDPVPIVLPGRNIESGSVAVRNTAGTLTFVEGVDYTVQHFSDRVELMRVVGGSIADGQAVLADFDIGPSPSVSTTSFQTALSARYDIQEGPVRGLAFYGDFRDTTQELDSDDPLISPTNVRVYRAGSEFRRRPFTFSAEYEHRDSDLSPFNAVRLHARYDQRLGRNSIISVHASHETFDFLDENNTVDLDRILAEWSQHFDGGLDLRLRLLYRDERSDFGGDTRGFEQVFELNWGKRQTRLFASVRNSILESDSEDSLSQTFVFGLRRDF